MAPYVLMFIAAERNVSTAEWLFGRGKWSGSEHTKVLALAQPYVLSDRHHNVEFTEPPYYRQHYS